MDTDGNLRICVGGYVSYRHPYHEHRWVTITHPVRNGIVVQMAAPESTWGTSGLIMKLKSSQRKAQLGKVLLKGEGEYIDPDGGTSHMDDIPLGETVLFRPVTGTPLYFNSELAIWFFRSHSILAKVQDYDPEHPPHTPIDASMPEKYEDII